MPSQLKTDPSPANATRRGRIASALGRIVAHPDWARAYWRGWRGLRSRGTHRGETFALADYPDALRDEREAVIELTGVSGGDYERALASAWFPPHIPGDAVATWSREVLLRILAAVCHLIRPRVVVEVGVERGYSSAVILHALERSGAGRLHSVDIPPLREGAEDFTGQAVPEALRERWELAIGPSRSVLPGLVARLDPIDLFVHDGDHSYESQREDLEATWPRIRPGGIVLVDDVWTAALFDFAADHGQHPLVIERADSQDAVGLLRKSE